MPKFYVKHKTHDHNSALITFVKKKKTLCVGQNVALIRAIEKSIPIHGTNT